jgi:hypothetical protein
MAEMAALISSEVLVDLGAVLAVDGSFFPSSYYPK